MCFILMFWKHGQFQRMLLKKGSFPYSIIIVQLIDFKHFISHLHHPPLQTNGHIWIWIRVHVVKSYKHWTVDLKISQISYINKKKDLRFKKIQLNYRYLEQSLKGWALSVKKKVFCHYKEGDKDLISFIMTKLVKTKKN